MPLPETWDGIFYSKETCGDMLFDLSPEQFVDELETHRDQLSGPPPFFIGGAYVDLKLNGHHDRAKDFLEAGKKKWPDAPWERLEIFIAHIGERLGSSVEDKDRHFIDAAIATMFGTWTIHPTT